MSRRAILSVLATLWILEPSQSYASNLITQMMYAKSRRDLVITRVKSKEREKLLELCKLQLSAGLVPVDCEWNKQTVKFLTQQCESAAEASEDIEEIKQALQSKKISSSCKNELRERYLQLSYQRAEINPTAEYEDLLKEDRHKM